MKSDDDLAKLMTDVKLCDMCGVPYIGDHTCKTPDQHAAAQAELLRDLQMSHAGDNDDLLPGTTLDGKYEIISILGQGGMGVVLKARDATLNRTVAVKVLHTEGSGASPARFKQEAAAAGGLEHPNIIRIWYYGVDERKRQYIVMDYLEGESLEDLLGRFPDGLSEKRAYEILVPICAALQHAHERGVIHRDLKPSNVMLVNNADGSTTIKLVDFGLAKMLPSAGQEAQKLTSTGNVLGTPLYMSPEQCLAMSLDARSDIYSMGCLIFAVFTGHPPFSNANVYETLYQHINDPPPSVTTRVAKVENDSEVDSVILKCMAKDPNDRYATMNDLADALRRVSEGQSAGNGWFLSDAISKLKLRAKAGKIKIPLPVKIVGLVAAISIVGGTAWYCGLWMQPAEARWKSLYLQSQQHIDRGAYSDAAKSLNEALLLVRSSAPLNKYVMPTLIELADLKALRGKPEEFVTEVKQLNASKESDTRGDADMVSHLEDAIDEAHNNQMSAQTRERYQRLCSSGFDDLWILLDAHQCQTAATELAKIDELLKICGDESGKLTVRSLRAHGTIGECTHDLKSAQDAYESAAALSIKTHQPALFKIYNSLALVYERQGKPESAKKTYELALDSARDEMGASSLQVAELKMNLGEFFLNQNDNKRAIEELEQSRALYDEFPDSPPRPRNHCYALLAVLSGDKVKLASTLALLEQSATKEDTFLAWILEELANAEGNTEASAGPLYRRAFVIGLRSLPRDQNIVDRLASHLSTWYSGRNDMSELQPLFHAQLLQDSQQFGADSEQVARDKRCLANFYRDSANFDRAEKYYKETVEQLVRTHKDRTWLAARTELELAFLYQDEKNSAEAEKTFKIAEDMMQNPASIGQVCDDTDAAIQLFNQYYSRTGDKARRELKTQQLRAFLARMSKADK